MMGFKERAFAPLVAVSLEELVPQDHFYRHLQTNQELIVTQQSVWCLDIFTKFMFLYISFIAFLTQRNPEKSDREIIDSLKEAQDARSFYISLIQNNSELRATVNSLVSELREQPIRNGTRSRKNYWKGINGVIRDETDWENLVEYWYRVRNNLFHGRKAPEFQRDRVLVTYAYRTLAPLMEHFIKHDLIWEFD